MRKILLLASGLRRAVLATGPIALNQYPIVLIDVVVSICVYYMGESVVCRGFQGTRESIESVCSVCA